MSEGEGWAFRPYRLRELELSNRIWVSSMCQYSADDGVVGDWHLMHLGSLASGRPGLIMAESTGVTPDGRISPKCTGIWNEEQVGAWRRVVKFVHELDVPIGLQLAHSGRKGSTTPPWQGEVDIPIEDGGWPVIGPSPIPFGDYWTPRQADDADPLSLRDAFVAATGRAIRAGFDVLEVHAAHGYLLHSFLSPLSNHRDDAYGGSLENRMRFSLAVIGAVREAWPSHLPYWSGSQ